MLPHPVECQGGIRNSIIDLPDAFLLIVFSLFTKKVGQKWGIIGAFDFLVILIKNGL